MYVKLTTILLMFFLFFANCSQMQRGSSGDALKQAEDHAEAGMEAFEEGNWQEAAILFDRALKIDAQCAEAYAGLSLVLAEKEQIEKALEYADKALQKKPTSPAATTAKGRVLLMTKKPERTSEAVRAFDEALRLDSKYEAAHYYKATALMQQNNFDAAKAQLSALIKIQGRFMERAAEKLQWLQKLQKAAPESEIGKKILTFEDISRADLAALLVKEFYIIDLANRRNPNVFGPDRIDIKNETNIAEGRAHSVNDISGHWAESYIRDVVRIGGMNIFPDKSFRPEDKIRRMDFALMIQQVFILVTGNRAIDTAFIGSPSPFPDVRQSHYAFNAISLAAERGIMAPDTQTGEFRMNDFVSGMSALLALRKLQMILNESS